MLAESIEKAAPCLSRLPLVRRHRLDSSNDGGPFVLLDLLVPAF